MIRILLADDHSLFREGVRLLLEREGYEVCGEASNGDEAVRMAKELAPDIVAMDLAMPGLDGMEAARSIKEFSDAKIILLTMHEEEAFMVKALRMGVNGYVLKAQTDSDLAFTIKMVSEGAFYLGPQIPPRVMEALTNNSELASETLTAREQQVLDLIADGCSTREVAAHLGLSPKTVESHRSRIMQKLNFTQTSQLISFAVRSQMTRH